MSIASGDLKCYQAASMPEDDVSTSGGAINTAGIIDNMILAASDSLKVKSSSASDSSGTTCTVYGRDAGGAIISEAHALNGTTAVSFTSTFERIEKVVLSGTTTVGIVTVYRSDGTTVVVAIPIAKTSVRRLFYNSASSTGTLVRYEKIFWKNEHGSLTLLSAVLQLTADPAARIRIAPATAVDDSGSVANRLTLPGGLTFYDDSVDAAVPGGAIASGSAIGAWIEQSLPANDPANKSTFTTQLSGNST